MGIVYIHIYVHINKCVYIYMYIILHSAHKMAGKGPAGASHVELQVWGKDLVI